MNSKIHYTHYGKKGRDTTACGLPKSVSAWYTTIPDVTCPDCLAVLKGEEEGVGARQAPHRRQGSVEGSVVSAVELVRYVHTLDGDQERTHVEVRLPTKAGSNKMGPWVALTDEQAVSLFSSVHKVELMAEGLEGETQQLGGFLRSRRKSLGLTGNEVADRVGRSQPRISRIENGQLVPAPDEFRELLEALEMEYGSESHERAWGLWHNCNF